MEVFPVALNRWIAVIDSFSTESSTATGVEREVRSAMRGVLKIANPHFVLVDERGAPWTPEDALAELDRLGIDYSSERPASRGQRWRRLLSRPAPTDTCPACGHGWAEHDPAERECGECVYEIEHEDGNAPAQPCHLVRPNAAK